LLKKGRDPSPPASLVDFAIDDNDEPTLLVARSRLPAGTLDLRAGDQLVALGSPPKRLANESQMMDARRGELDGVALTVLRDGEEVALRGCWPAAERIV